MDTLFPSFTMKDSRCPSDTQYLCGTKTPGRGVCVNESMDCDIRTIVPRPLPTFNGNNTKGARYGYISDNLGRGCYLSPLDLQIDYEHKNTVHQLVPASFALMTYNIWGIAKSEDLRRMFLLRKDLLIDTLSSSGADMICIQEMSAFAYKELEPFLDTWKYVSERPYTASAEDRNRAVDTFFISKYTPKRVANYSIPGVLGYANSMLVVEYANLVIFNLYSQAGSKFSVGQTHKWIHYARCRADILRIIYDMIQDMYKDQNVVVCGDLNFHLDGKHEDWPELEGIDAFRHIRFVDTYRVLHPRKPGYTEDTTLNLMRWNYKLMEKHLRYDAILYRGTTWMPTSSELIGTQNAYLTPSDSEWFFEHMSEAKTKSNLRGVKDGCLPISASDHFGVMTRFQKRTTGGRRTLKRGRRSGRRRTRKN